MNFSCKVESLIQGYVQRDYCTLILKPLIPHTSEPPQPASTAAVCLPSSDVPHGIMWSRSLAGLRCRFCQQKCGNEFVHLCDDCDHNYCIHCVRDLPRSRWFCYDCKPIVQVMPQKQMHTQHNSTTTDWKGGGAEREGSEESSSIHPCAN